MSYHDGVRSIGVKVLRLHGFPTQQLLIEQHEKVPTLF